MTTKSYLLIFALLLLGGPILLAQTEKKEKEAKKEKQYVIIRKKKADEGEQRIEIKEKDGNIIIQGDKVIQLKGDGVFIEKDKDAKGEKYFFNSEGDGDFHLNVNENDGTKHIVIEFTDENGAKQHLEWEGEGEVPPHIQKYLHKPEHNGEMEWITVEGQLHEAHEERAFLGVSSAVEMTKTVEIIDGEETIVESTENATEGAVIDEVISGSAAEEAGLQAEDVILAIDGQPVGDFNDLRDLLEDHQPGDEISVQYRRGDETRKTNATLKSGPANATFEWHSEDSNISTPVDGENIFMFRSGDDFDEDQNVIIIKKIDKVVEIAEVDEVAEVEELPELELERSLQMKEFEAFPNPTSGQLQLNFQSKAGPITIRVSNMRGQQVYREYIRDFDGVYNQSLDLSDLSGGAYVLSVEQEGKIFSEQLIVK